MYTFIAATTAGSQCYLLILISISETETKTCDFKSARVNLRHKIRTICVRKIIALK